MPCKQVAGVIAIALIDRSQQSLLTTSLPPKWRRRRTMLRSPFSGALICEPVHCFFLVIPFDIPRYGPIGRAKAQFILPSHRGAEAAALPPNISPLVFLPLIMARHPPRFAFSHALVSESC
jgi:hypothetical protein